MNWKRGYNEEIPNPNFQSPNKSQTKIFEISPHPTLSPKGRGEG
jgi:hypothetical protein